VNDLNIVLGNWNQTIVGWNNGDFDGDGFVGIGDLNIVLGNWNAGTPPSAGTTIPEPSTILVLVGSVVGYIQSRHRR